MTTGITNIFNDIVSRADLTEEQRVTQLSTALGDLLPKSGDGAPNRDELEAYFSFKCPYTAALDTLKAQYKLLSETTLVVRVEPLAAEAAKYGPEDDVSETSPLRVKSAGLRQKLAAEQKMLADASASNARLTAAYKMMIAAEQKTSRLPSVILEESRAALRELDNNRDPAFRANIQGSVETILNNIDKQLDAIAGHQHKLLERKMFHKYLDAGLTTGGKPLAAPATARFRKVQVQP
ncbi:MAG: hypothetical protein K0R10_1371 [Alphaproteobacteria bacterium]|jgi:hypothetical protein|nr:hypothetical protein [Alphaproteobacteria bacterium]